MIVLVILFIWGNSVMPASVSSLESNRLYQLILPLAKPLHLEGFLEVYIRKVAHFVEYFVLGALMSAHALLGLRKRARTSLWVLLAGAAVAVVDESIQLFAEGRSCQVSDMLLDCSGVLAALVLAQLIYSIISIWVKDN